MSFFTDSLLNELSQTPDHLAQLITKLSHEKQVCIWGTGVAGQLVCKTGRSFGIPVTCFADGNKKDGCTQTLLGLPVRSPAEIPADAFVLIEADVRYQIHERVRHLQCTGYAYIDPLLFSHYRTGDRERVMQQYSENAAEIDRVYDAFRDDLSRRTFRNVLMHRAVHSLELLWEVFSPNQYFCNDVIQNAAGSFADCGAFNGDTLRAFLAQVGEQDYSYYAFEPQEQNCRDLEQFVQEQQLSRVQVCRAGIWDRQETLCFSENTAEDDLAWTLSDAVTGSESLIHADTLDHLMNGKPLDFIKMDIEGAELRALRGAEFTIRSSLPILAISSYHELDHLWLVPRAIQEFSGDYHISCRHHSWNLADTVCYGIAQKEGK
jgi:FkbM family methyltransferase